MYDVRLTKAAQKGYDGILLTDYKLKVNGLFDILAINPRPSKSYDMLKLNDNTYRIRLGKVRVQYTVFENERVILVYKIELRDDSTYKK